MTTSPAQGGPDVEGIEIDTLRRKLKAMHRRAQTAEAALGDYRRIIASPPNGDGVRFISGSMGRVLLAAYCNQLLARIDDLHDSLRVVYASVPPLPITAETEDAATDALHAFCLLIGIHQVDVGPPAPAQGEREEAPRNG